MALVGVDIGTQGTKAAIYSHDGRLLGQSFEASQLHRPDPGVVEEDADQQALSVCRTIRACIESSGINAADIEAVAIDGQMAGVIGVGAGGGAVTPYDSWLDTRCAPQIQQMQQKAGGHITRSTGCAPSFNHGPKILWWKQERGEAFDRIVSFVQPGGYATMRLCGLSGSEAFIDSTYLHFSGYADNLAAEWSDELCATFDIPKSKLPRIVEPSAVVGSVGTEASSMSALRQGTPVVAGCGDTAASFLSCGATRDGVCVDVAGTASVFAATTGEFVPDTRSGILGCGRGVVPGLWHPYAYVNGGGLNIEWLRDLLGEASADERAADLARLNALAAEVVPGLELPFFVPHFGGRVMPPLSTIRGAWVGLDWSHGLGVLYRSMLESIALEYAIYQEALLKAYPGFVGDELRVTGGGENSFIWNAIKASALGLPVVSIQGGGGAPMGSALLAGYGAGVLPDLSSAVEKWVQTAGRVEPRREDRAYYDARLARYKRVTLAVNDALA